MTSLRGLHAALLTPFGASGNTIDTDALGRLARHNIGQGLTGLYVGGSTGEAFLMSLAERLLLFAAVAEAAAGDCVLIAHVGDVNPEVSKQLAKEAERLGYDAISALPPYYYNYTFVEIREHYDLLASQTALPFLVYNYPGLSGVSLSSERLAELLALPNVVGVKNTCPDYFAFERLRRWVPDKLLFNGFDETMLAGLCIGADGGIGSTYNVQGSKFMGLLKAYEQGDTRSAAAIQAEINQLIDVLIEHGVFQSLKYLLERWGLSMGACRPPFRALSREAKAALDRAAARYLVEPAGGSLA